ncbi:MAG: FG-GAP repeat domain-containing protein, partial [Bacteroidota bacterium]
MRNFLFLQLLSAVVSLSLLLASCGGDNPQDSSAAGPALFEQMAPATTGIDFINQIVNTKDINYLNFTYLYMSGGAGVGDFNNDGLPDVYFGATMGPNKLYLNKGNFQFEDISVKAGIT